MDRRTIRVAGREVWLDGDRGPVVVMLHGWPDGAALWDATVAALAGGHRCVRFTWPGFAAGDERRAWSLAELVELLHRVVVATAGDEPVTLLLHDWGCVFGYAYAQRHPDRVARVIGVDVGDAGSPAHRSGLRWRAVLAIAAYQLTLALAWRIGGRLGDRIARSLAARMRVPAPAAAIAARMGYPYWIAWTATHGSYRGVRPPGAAVPMLYVYGRRKPFMFQSRAWLAELAARPHGRVVEMPTGHWVMVEQPQAFAAAVHDWLAATAEGLPAARSGSGPVSACGAGAAPRAA